MWCDQLYFGGSSGYRCQPVERGTEFAQIIAVQVEDVGVLRWRSQLLNYLLGAVLMHGNRITA